MDQKTKEKLWSLLVASTISKKSKNLRYWLDKIRKIFWPLSIGFIIGFIARSFFS